ncbi:MAG: hypothetical protein LBH36_01105 [Candidatus Nomurabacteria bacterium]|jgi:hypothetical protein|nr:hypothetical protein [Candidatus Nomurabacteria bacterium]
MSYFLSTTWHDMVATIIQLKTIVVINGCALAADSFMAAATAITAIKTPPIDWVNANQPVAGFTSFHHLTTASTMMSHRSHATTMAASAICHRILTNGSKMHTNDISRIAAP